MSEILKSFLANEKALRRYIARFCAEPQDVEDLAQETFLSGFAAEMRTEIREPKAFLFRIARNLVFSARRQKRRRPNQGLEELGGSDLLMDEDQMDAAAWLDGRRKLALLAQAVAHLPPQCRKAFLLRRVDGLEYKQIANRMNISVSSVEKHVANGLLKCNAFLRARGYDPSEFSAPSAPSKPEPAEHTTHNFVRVNAKDERD